MAKKIVTIGFTVVITLLTAGSANAQSIRDDIKNAIDRKYAILQQQADTERMRAETERTRAEAETSTLQRQSYSGGTNSSPSPHGYVVGIDHDSLARIYPATYRLSNGMVLQVTGLFEPDAPTICIANCP